MSALGKRIETFEAEIRAGRARHVARELAALSPRRTPRQFRLKLANLCRRTALYTTGLRFLAPLVHDETATAPELAEYAMLLLRSDLLDEAWKTLEKVDASKAPEVLLFKSFHHFRNWREPEAIPLLERYLEHTLDPYQAVVGRLNLAAAYVGSSKYSEGEALLDELIATARSSSFSRVLGNCLELRAQIDIKQGDLARARVALDASARELDAMGTSDAIYMKKWRAFVEAYETKSVAALVGFRAVALASREWESVREADRHRLRIEFDADVHAHLMFGTPFERYRELVTQELGRSEPTGSFVMGSGPRLELAEIFKPGGLSHRLLSTLVQDFYRPTRVGTLYTDLYPGERFDVATSPDRVHQALRRTRRQLEKLRVPLEIVEKDGDFSLVIKGHVSIAVPYHRKTPTPAAVHVDRLRSIFGNGETFDAPSARERLAIPRTTFQRFVKEALEAKLIEKIGERNATRYRIAA